MNGQEVIFGLLAISSHPALRAIGLVAGVGVALLIVWLIATRAAATAPQPEENRQAS